MPQLSDLPPEVVLHVANEVHPGDIVNFAITCRSFLVYSMEALQRHRDYTQKFRQLQCDSIDTPEAGLLPLLQRVVDEPRASHYVSIFSFDESAVTTSDQGISNRDVRLEHVRVLIDAVHALKLPAEMHRTSWYQSLRHQKVSALLSLYLCNLRNLRVLDWRAEDFTMALRLWSFIIAVVNAPSTLFLSKLEQVFLQSGDRNDRIPVWLVAAFMRLPSMKFIHADSVIDAKPLKCTPKDSNVTHISLSHNNFGNPYCEWLDEILSAPRQLISFTCRRPLGTIFEAKCIRTSLLRHAKHTLRRLTVRTCDEMLVEVLGDLGEFDCMTYLDTDFALLFDVEILTLHQARKLLPSSLEELRLHEDGAIVLDSAFLELCNLLKFKQKAFPGLARLEIFLDQALEFHDGMNDVHDRVRKLAVYCVRNGMELKAQFCEEPWSRD